MNRTLAVLTAVLVLGCTTAANQTQSAAPPSEFKNLQILPRTITRPELMNVMRGFTRGLGVRCDHCHAPTNPPSDHPDFPSDAKEEKRVARVMMQMAAQINGAWMERVQTATGRETGAGVTCWTCHRGKPLPEAPPPPPPPANPS